MEVVQQAACLGWIGVRAMERAPAAGLGRLCRIIQDQTGWWLRRLCELGEAKQNNDTPRLKSSHVGPVRQ